ncbi:60S acidic ribosomal protein P1-like isoform X2 [Papaver somniferum]|uniref:60S acidic ribosomal protein P1-like isoform X2 n=1 Tax=Papaver somniferum TaxID=3469 RepID=UPI000E702B3B|nr:60S acidic ribosomal protein P1-like isoform X2 [Papaver somniferum]XP_026438956.1 60S acidic ribosomal protein P1-like isoform X2 [Papaver somniferum]XP_026438959.1 60S acidic ribosomal protein P1-like isoform X2 [Papaver somniferum]XP_026438965.1 60S acidic ribosomal protein P1-like isoform X2 [Papaver somniferum]
MSSNGEVACTYAALILHDDGIPITAEKILTLVKKANVQCESYWPSLFAKFVERKNVEDLITNVGATGGGATAVEAPAAEEKKKKEEKEESDDEDMDLFSIFD